MNNISEKIENYKSLLTMIYNTKNIDHVISNDKSSALLRLSIANNNGGYTEHTYKTLLLRLSDMSCTDMELSEVKTLPITKNLVGVGNNNDTHKLLIKIIDKNNFDTIEITELSEKECATSITVGVFLLLGFIINNDEGYTRIDIRLFNSESPYMNIHGQTIELDSTYKKLFDSSFFSKEDNKIKIYDNIEDMRFIREISLDTYNDSIEYFAITNSKGKKTNKKQVLFIWFKKTDNIYAYCFNDNTIYKVEDNRFSITIEEFKDKLKECLYTNDSDRINKYSNELRKFKGDIEKQKEYEKKQFDLDIKCIEKLNENKFNLVRSKRNGKDILTLRTVEQCIIEYQREYNGENLKEKRGITDIRLSDADKFMMYSLTPYKIKSMDLLRKLVMHRGADRIDVLDIPISVEEIKILEGI